MMFVLCFGSERESWCLCRFLQAEKQIHLASCLDKLMTDVQRNLEPRNRDKFTQVRIILIHVSSNNANGRLRLAFVHAEFDHPAA